MTALNIALERENLVNKVIADSLEGEEAVDGLVNTIYEEREKTKSREQGRLFWKYCHGDDWEQVVDNDTDVVIRHGQHIKNSFTEICLSFMYRLCFQQVWLMMNMQG